MAQVENYKRIWRVAALALLILAIIGPWVFDLIMVPAEYPCSAPNVRLDDDFCGLPMSGLWVLAALIGNIIGQLAALASGTPAPGGFGQAILSLLALLVILLPIFSTLFLLKPGSRQRKLPFQAIVWGLAAACSLWMALSLIDKTPIRLWGLWLYIATALLGLILEAVTLALGSRPAPAHVSDL